MRWWFCKGDPGKPPLELPDINAAQLLIANREDFEGRRDDVGADTLANAGSFKDPWHEPIIKLGRAVGLPFDEACLFAEGLIARGIVDIVPAYTGLESPGEQSFGELKQWCVAKRRTAQNQKEANKEKARRGRATNGIG